MEPVYPKDNGSLERSLEAFRKKVANWNWDKYDADDYQGKPRGRKAKIITRIETKPRTKTEEKVFINKFFNYNK